MICSGVCLRRAIVMSLLRPAIQGNGLSQRVDRSQGVRPEVQGADLGEQTGIAAAGGTSAPPPARAEPSRWAKRNSSICSVATT
jgi:hypothetical protein